MGDDNPAIYARVLYKHGVYEVGNNLGLTRVPAPLGYQGVQQVAISRF